MNEFGYCNGIYIYNWINDIIYNKTKNNNYTFNDLWKNKKVDLIITGSNITTSCVNYYSHREYGNMKIKDAVRIALSLPIQYKPINWDNQLVFSAT